MGKKILSYLWLCSLAVFVFSAGCAPTAGTLGPWNPKVRGPAAWKKVAWKGLPKNKKGKLQNAGTVAIVGKDNVYFTFSGSHLFHWDGKSFKEIKHEKSGNRKWDIRNIVANSDKDIWAFGDNGLSLHFDGKKWKNIKNPLTGVGRRPGRLWGSGCVTPNKCFAGTRAGDLIEWNGSSWKLVSKSGQPPAEGSRVYAIQFISKDNGWMAGEALMAKWNGKKWKKVNIEVPRIYDMSIVDKNFGWIVGDGGAFFKFDGKTWKKVSVKGSFFRMRGVSCSSRTYCLAVGDAGAAFEWDGKGWKKIKMGTFGRFNRVRFAHGQGWLVGAKGGIFKLTGGIVPVPAN